MNESDLTRLLPEVRAPELARRLDEASCIPDDAKERGASLAREVDPRSRKPPADDSYAEARRVLDFIALKPVANITVKLHASRFIKDQKRVDRILRDLEADGAIESFKRWDGKKTYRVPGAADPPPPPPSPTTKETTTMPKPAAVWISVEDAMELLGYGRSYVRNIARKGKIESRQTEDGELELSHASCVAYRDAPVERKAKPAAPAAKRKPRPPKTIEKVAKKHTVRKPHIEAAAEAGDWQRSIRWLIDGYRLKQFTADEAIERIAQLVA